MLHNGELLKRAVKKTENGQLLIYKNFKNLLKNFPVFRPSSVIDYKYGISMVLQQ